MCVIMLHATKEMCHAIYPGTGRKIPLPPHIFRGHRFAEKYRYYGVLQCRHYLFNRRPDRMNTTVFIERLFTNVCFTLAK